MPKTWLYLVLLALAAGAFASAGSAQTDETTPALTEYVVIADTVNLRAGPGTNFEIVGDAQRGERVFAYAQENPQGDWLRLYRGAEMADAYIAVFLVEAAPIRYYPLQQAAEQRVEGNGSSQQYGPFQFTGQAYRVDVRFEGSSFALEAVADTGSCTDQELLDIAIASNGPHVASTVLLTGECAWVFEVYDAVGSWALEFRPLQNSEGAAFSMQAVAVNPVINGTGTQFSNPLRFPPGNWQLLARVQDQSFVLRSLVASGECGLQPLVFNVLQQGANEIMLSANFAVGSAGCVLYWQTDNVDGPWTLRFAPWSALATPSLTPEPLAE